MCDTVIRQLKEALADNPLFCCMNYLTRTPWWLKLMYQRCVWQMPKHNRNVYLSFDDGPHPRITPFVLEQLALYQAKATFFCIGKNVAAYPLVYQQILAAGHAVGNHTQHHVNGWHTSLTAYLDDIREAGQYINSKLFRPPYGKITWRQARKISSQLQLKPVMWSVLSADFDTSITKEQCWKFAQQVAPGDIIVFHDSEKAYKNMAYALPLLLEYIQKNGWNCETIS
jgi:peptidoglycan/xylan/chitin deacetylase (PgdA/CDA1 family)